MSQKSLSAAQSAAYGVMALMLPVHGYVCVLLFSPFKRSVKGDTVRNARVKSDMGQNSMMICKIY